MDSEANWSMTRLLSVGMIRAGFAADKLPTRAGTFQIARR